MNNVYSTLMRDSWKPNSDKVPFIRFLSHSRIVDVTRCPSAHTLSESTNSDLAVELNKLDSQLAVSRLLLGDMELTLCCARGVM